MGSAASDGRKTRSACKFLKSPGAKPQLLWRSLGFCFLPSLSAQRKWLDRRRSVLVLPLHSPLYHPESYSAAEEERGAFLGLKPPLTTRKTYSPWRFVDFPERVYIFWR